MFTVYYYCVQGYSFLNCTKTLKTPSKSLVALAVFIYPDLKPGYMKQSRYR